MTNFDVGQCVFQIVILGCQFKFAEHVDLAILIYYVQAIDSATAIRLFHLHFAILGIGRRDCGLVEVG